MTTRTQSRKINPRGRHAMLLMLAITAVAAPLSSPVQAAVTWDHAGASPTHAADGAGNWDTASAFWSNGTADTAWINDGTSIANIGNANGAAGTVTINVATINAAAVNFAAAGSGNYTLAATTGDTLTLTNSAAITVTGAISPTISAVITGTSGLSYTGSIGTTVSTLILSGANTYSGTTTVNAGLLETSNNATLGTSTVTVLSGGDAQIGTSAALTVTNNFTIAGTGTSATGVGAIVLRGTISGNITLNGNARIGDAGFGDTLSGILSGTGNLEFYSAASGSSSFTINNTNNAWVGTTTITNNSSTSNGTILKMGASNILPVANPLIINATGTGFAELDLSGRGETVAGLSSSGVAANDKIINSAAGNGTLTISSSSNTTFSGTILSGTGAGLTNVIKSGTGTQTFGGANTYTGTTTINQGVLAVTGSLASGAVTVNNTGTLAGNGTVAGAVTANNGGFLSGASTGGTLALTGSVTLGNLTTDSETLNLTANAASLTTASVAVTGGAGLTINSTSTTVNVASTGALGIGEYALLTYSATSGTPISSAFALGTLPQRVVGNLDTATAGLVSLNVTGVDFPVWSGAVSNAWVTSASVQTGSPDNWVLNSNAATATNFVAGDNVLFNDNASNTTVDISSGNVAPGSVIFNNSAKDYTITGTNGISGGTTVMKNGTGSLTISNANTYTGGTTLNAGTLAINNGGALGTGPLTIAGGSIDNTSGANVTLSTNNVQFWNADIDFKGTNNLNLGTGAVTLNATRTVTVVQNTLTVGGSIGGNFGLTKAGPGVLVLSGGNTYTGTTTINAGTLVVTNSSALGAFTGAGVIINGGTLDVGGDTTANNVQFNTTNSNGLSFTIAGTGATGIGAVTNSNANITQFNTFRGSNVTLSADALISGNRIDIGRDGTAFSTLDLAGHTLTLSMSGSQPMFGIESHGSVTDGNIVVAQGALDIEQNANVTGSGTITFDNGANAQFYQTAGTNVTRPIVFNGNNTIGSGNAATIAIVNSPMTFNGNVTLEALANGIPSLTATNALNLAGNLAESGGSYAVTKAGVSTVTLSGTADNWTGGTNIQQGTLLLNSAGALPTGTVLTFGLVSANTSASGTLDLNGQTATVSGLSDVTGAGNIIGSSSTTAPSTLAFAGNATPSTFAGTIQDAISTGTQTTSLSMTAGNLTLTGTNTYSGGTNVSGGTLVAGNEQALGKGGLAIHAGTVQFQNGFAKAMVQPSVTIDGTGNLDLANNKIIVEPTSGKAAALASLQAQAHSGITSSTMAANFAVAVIDNAVLSSPFTTFGGLAVDANSILVSPELLGDSNADGHVDLSDLSTVLNNFGATTAAWTSDNFDGAATIDLTDLSAVLNNFGLSNPNAFDQSAPGSGTVVATATPEPASLAMLGLGAVALLTRRKRA